jgi:hypothetical protein
LKYSHYEKNYFLTKITGMKTLSKMTTLRFLVTLFVFNLISLLTFAQDQGTGSTGSSSQSTTTTSTEHTEWYTAPWVWIVGGAVLILLLVALLSGGRSSSRSTVTRTVDTGRGSVTTVRDSDVDA